MKKTQPKNTKAQKLRPRRAAFLEERYSNMEDYSRFNDTTEKAFIKCSCHSEILFLEQDDDGMLTICIYSNNDNVAKRPMNFLDRIRFCIHTLFTGEVWGDNCVLGKEEIKELKSFINKIN